MRKDVGGGKASDTDVGNKDGDESGAGSVAPAAPQAVPGIEDGNEGEGDDADYGDDVNDWYAERIFIMHVLEYGPELMRKEEIAGSAKVDHGWMSMAVFKYGRDRQHVELTLKNFDGNKAALSNAAGPGWLDGPRLESGRNYRD